MTIKGQTIEVWSAFCCAEINQAKVQILFFFHVGMLHVEMGCVPHCPGGENFELAMFVLNFWAYLCKLVIITTTPTNTHTIIPNVCVPVCKCLQPAHTMRANIHTQHTHNEREENMCVNNSNGKCWRTTGNGEEEGKWCVWRATPKQHTIKSQPPPHTCPPSPLTSNNSTHFSHSPYLVCFT